MKLSKKDAEYLVSAFDIYFGGDLTEVSNEKKEEIYRLLLDNAPSFPLSLAKEVLESHPSESEVLWLERTAKGEENAEFMKRVFQLTLRMRKELKDREVWRIASDIASNSVPVDPEDFLYLFAAIPKFIAKPRTIPSLARLLANPKAIISIRNEGALAALGNILEAAEDNDYEQVKLISKALLKAPSLVKLYKWRDELEIKKFEKMGWKVEIDRTGRGGSWKFTLKDKE